MAGFKEYVPQVGMPPLIREKDRSASSEAARERPASPDRAQRIQQEELRIIAESPMLAADRARVAFSDTETCIMMNPLCGEALNGPDFSRE